MTVKQRLLLIRQMDAQSGWVIIKRELVGGSGRAGGPVDEVRQDE